MYSELSGTFSHSRKNRECCEIEGREVDRHIERRSVERSGDVADGALARLSARLRRQKKAVLTPGPCYGDFS